MCTTQCHDARSRVFEACHILTRAPRVVIYVRRRRHTKEMVHVSSDFVPQVTAVRMLMSEEVIGAIRLKPNITPLRNHFV